MKQTWLEPTIQQWVTNVEILSKVAIRYPQSAYTALTYSIQAEWQYLSRVMPLTSEVLFSIEAAICSKFLPALLGVDSIDDDFRSLLCNGVKQAGIGIKDPTTTADALYSSSCSATNLLVEAMLQNSQLDLIEHRKNVRQTSSGYKQSKIDTELQMLNSLSNEHGRIIQQRLLRASGSGAWLTVMPNKQHGTALNAEEFRDNI